MKRFIYVFVFIMIFPALVFAQYTGPNSTDADTVHEALKRKNNTYITLTGNIVESLGKGRYTFRDETSSVKVKIDDDIWQNFTAGPSDIVIIYGQLKKSLADTEIIVKSIKKLD